MKNEKKALGFPRAFGVTHYTYFLNVRLIAKSVLALCSLEERQNKDIKQNTQRTQGNNAVYQRVESMLFVKCFRIVIRNDRGHESQSGTSKNADQRQTEPPTAFVDIMQAAERKCYSWNKDQ